MKKFLFTFMLMFALSFMIPTIASAETYFYKTTEFAYKQMNDYGKWTKWSDWEESNMLISINFTTDVVVIFSPRTQRYKITEHIRNYTDNSGGKQSEYKFIDQDGDIGNMRLRKERNGNCQLYIEFINMMWVYNIKQISEPDEY